ncbi:MAG TPA: AI-2E family transporter [Anaerolineales bacterium]|nr:AI-2E family transporter [Anaerolineales bacterium]
MSNADLSPPSPSWSSTTKLVIGLTFVAIFTALLVYFRTIIGPLLLAVILAYALHPLAARINRATNLNWRWSVNLIYLVLVIIVLGLLTASGFAIVQQLQSLISVVNNFTRTLPELVAQISQQTYTFGPFEFSLKQYDLQSLTNQVLGTLQPLLGRVGTLVGTFATGAFSTLGWGFFVLLISYFLLAESGKVSSDLIRIDIPGYSTDIRRLGNELVTIWNVFLRGQLVMFLLATIIYTILMTGLGLRYSLAIAILAGIARFIPYIGPLVVWIVTALVALLQGQNYFGLQAWQYAAMVLITALIIDQILDNVVNPRFMGHTLGVHPAAVLVAALVAANLIGIVGVVLAAPVLASMVLLGRYFSRKMLDLDPWLATTQPVKPMEYPWVRLIRRLRAWLRMATRRA